MHPDSPWITEDEIPQQLTLSLTGYQKVTVYLIATGESVQVTPVDSREYIKSGAYSLKDPKLS